MRTGSVVAELPQPVLSSGAQHDQRLTDRSSVTHPGNAIVIDVNTAVAQLPETMLAEHAEGRLAELRAMRTYLAHDYANAEYRIAWNALAGDPVLVEQRGLR